MSFLAPLFLIGALFVVGPVLFHLIRRSPRNRVVFSSTELLDATEPKIEKSPKLQNPLLLLIRCLIVLLLTIAFARPFFSESEGLFDHSVVPKNVIIAIDQSASMLRSGIESNLRKKVGDLIDELGPQDSLSIFTFTDSIDSIIDSSEWDAMPANERVSLVGSRLDKLRATPLPASLTLALTEIAERTEMMQEDSAQLNYSVAHIVSDFASGMYSSNVDSFEWADNLEIVRHEISPENDETNLGISWNGWSEGSSGSSLANLIIVSSDSSSPATAQVRVFDQKGSEMAQAVTLPFQSKTKQTIQIQIPQQFRNQPLRFELSGDSHPFDNALSVAPSYSPEVNVALLSNSGSSDTEASPYFITRAFAGLETPRTVVTFDSSDFEDVDLIFIDRPLSQQEATNVRSAIDQGKIAFVTASHSDFTKTLDAISLSEKWTLKNRSDAPLLIGEVDLAHPLFSPFSNARFSNFTAIKFWESVNLQFSDKANASVLARFDNGSPLLVEERIGQGSLYVWASSWEPKSSQWVLSSKFVPTLHQLLLQAVGDTPLSSNAILTSKNVSNYQALLGDTDTLNPGFADAVDNNRVIAFQLSPQESQTTPLSQKEWERFALPKSDPQARQAALRSLALKATTETERANEQRQGVWRWLLWLVFALLLSESLLAILARRKEGELAS